MTAFPPPDAADVAQAQVAAERDALRHDPKMLNGLEALFGISFSQPLRAQEFLLAMHGLAQNGRLVVSDAVVVTKDDNGKVHVVETTDRQPVQAAMSGAMWSGLLGLLLAGPVGWLAGLGIGAGAGALSAKLIDIGIPDEWVDWFKEAVQPHTATVVVLAADIDLQALTKEAERFAGAQLVHTTLTPDASAMLAAALIPHRDRGARA